MKQHFYIFAFFLLLSLPLTANVHPTRFTHCESDFKMSRTADVHDSVKVQYGHFSYDALGLIQWVYENAREEDIPKELRLFTQRFFNSETIRNCSEYRVEQMGDMVYLYPKKKLVQKWFKEAQVYFNPLTGFIRDVVLIEPTDDVITIEFFNLEAR